MEKGGLSARLAEVGCEDPDGDITVKLVEQPPYSPELNPAERVFEHLRGKVEGQVYGTIEAKKRAIEAELEKLAAAPNSVKSLVGWDWIRQSVKDLPSPNTVFQ